MDTPHTGPEDHPAEPAPSPPGGATTGSAMASEGAISDDDGLDVSSLDEVMAQAGARRRRRSNASRASSSSGGGAGADSASSEAMTTGGVAVGVMAGEPTPLRRRKSTRSWRSRLLAWWPSSAPPGSEQALPPPPMRRAQRIERRVVWSLAIVAGLASVGSTAHPTGVLLPDVALRFVFALVVTLAAGRARRSTWLVLAGGAAVLAPGGWWTASALVALAVAVASTLVHRRKWLGAVVAAFAVPALLRAEPFAFTGASALCTWLIVTPVLVSGYRVASRRSRHRMQQIAMVTFLVVLGGSLLFGLAVLMAWGDLESGSKSAESGLQALSDGQGPEAAVRLADSADALGSAHDVLGAWWTAPARLVPIVAQQAEAMSVLTEQGKAIASAGSAAASKADYRRLRYEGGQVDVDRLRALQDPLAAAADTLDAAGARFRGVSSPWLVGPVADELARVSDEVDRIQPQADLAASGAAVAPGLLGADGPRHYFVAFTTEAEARGLNGFMGNWAELTADGGKLTLSRSGRVSELNDVPGADQRTVTGPPDYVARYGPFKPGTYFQDVTLSPDLPSVAQVIGELYPQMGGQPIDGVIVVDPYGLAALLNFTGPIDVAGSPETLTPDNAADILVRRQYLEFGDRSTRADFLDEASRATFEKLTTGDIPGPERIGAILGPAVQDKHLMFSAVRPQEEAFLTDLGADGALPAARPDRDFFAVTGQNSANNKIDVFLHRTISYDATYDPATGGVRATATVTLHNDAPASGLPASVIGSNDRGLPPGTNRTFVSFYSPLDLVSGQVDGQPQGFQSQRELGYHVYSRYIGIPPGGSATVVLDLTGTIGSRADYALAVGVQPMVNADTFDVAVHPAAGWEVVDADVLRSDIDRKRASFLLEAGHDLDAWVRFSSR